MKIKTFYRKLTFCFFIVISIISNPLIGQTHFIIPHHGNSLKLQDKYNFHLSIGGMIGGDEILKKRNQQLQLGYSPLNHIGVSIFYSRINNSRIRRGIKSRVHNSQQTGIEIGTYYAIKLKDYVNGGWTKKSLNQRKFLGSLYAGYTNGKLKNNYYGDNSVTLSNVNMNFKKYYIHTGIHWIGRVLEFSGFLKTGKTNYYKGIIEGQEFWEDSEYISTILQNNIHTFIDYTFKAEVKRNLYGVYGQFTSSHIKSIKNNPITRINIGVVFYLDEIIKKYRK